MFATPESLVGYRLDDRYDIVAHLAGGSFGAVYRARHLTLGRDVAIKIVHQFAPPQHATRLQREARLLAALDHPRVVPIHDSGRLADGRPYLVESFIEGSTLGAVLRRDGYFSTTRAVGLITQLLDGLSAVHALGVIHRDIKPSNLMLTERTGRDELRLIDFGIARSTDITDAFETLTATGMIIGTPTHMAPEQILGEPVGPATDLYAAGIVLYEMLAGRPPFDRQTIIHTLRAHIDDPPPPLSQAIPDPIRRVVMRALAKAPADRFASADEMATALASATAIGLGLHDRYHVERVLGSGSFGDVLLARHKVLGREVAIKIGTVNDPAAEARFVREAKIMLDLHHPGLVTLREFGKLPDGRSFMVQDRVEGRPLSEVLATEGALSPPRATRIMLGILAPLHAAHERGVIHRDLKPSNVMVEDDDGIRVIDFGLARPAGADDEALTAQGFFVGTVAYGSPEQSYAKGITPLADVYAAGIVLYELLTGKQPFIARNALDLIMMHRERPLPALPATLPAELRRIVQRATAKSPEDRYASAAEMADALRRTLRRDRKGWLIAAAASLVAIGALVALALWFFGGSEPEVEPEDDVVVRIGTVRTETLVADLKDELTACLCVRARGTLDMLNDRDATLGREWQAQWDAACTGSKAACTQKGQP